MINKTIATLSLVLAACSVETQSQQVLKSEKCKELTEDLKYDSAVDSYFQKWKLTDGWDLWMKENHDRFCGTFYKTQELKNEITIAVDMYQNPANFYKNSSWAGSSEHLKTLEEVIELTYYGWDVNLILTLDPEVKEQSDFVLYLGYSEASHYEGKNIFVHYDPIVNHELAHLLDLQHDYDLLENVGKGIYSAPGETKCLMDRNWNQFGSPERFALGIPMNVDNEKEIKDLVVYLNSKYLENY